MELKVETDNAGRPSGIPVSLNASLPFTFMSHDKVLTGAKLRILRGEWVSVPLDHPILLKGGEIYECDIFESGGTLRCRPKS